MTSAAETASAPIAMLDVDLQAMNETLSETDEPPGDDEETNISELVASVHDPFLFVQPRLSRDVAQGASCKDDTEHVGLRDRRPQVPRRTRVSHDLEMHPVSLTDHVLQRCICLSESERDEWNMNVLTTRRPRHTLRR